MQEYTELHTSMDENGKLMQLPGKRQKKKLDLMLQYLADKFEPTRKYTEVEVNELLNRYHSFGDPATLRRMLFGTQKIDRTIDGRSYWLL